LNFSPTYYNEARGVARVTYKYAGVSFIRRRQLGNNLVQEFAASSPRAWRKPHGKENQTDLKLLTLNFNSGDVYRCLPSLTCPATVCANSDRGHHFTHECFNCLHIPAQDEELQEMVDEADRDGDNAINEEEFYRVMKKRGENPLDDLSSDED